MANDRSPTFSSRGKYRAAGRVELRGEERGGARARRQRESIVL
jgi:hypothetical protein